MKTILYVYHASNIGGGTYCLLNIIKALDRKAYRPIVLLGRDGPLVAELKALDVDVLFISKITTVPYNKSIFTLHNIVRMMRIVQSLKLFCNILHKIKPDIVYINTMMLYPFLRIAKKNGIKTVIHIREHWPENQHYIQRNLAISQIRKFADEVIAINSYSASMIENKTHSVNIIYDWIDLSNRYEDRPYSKIFNEDCSHKKVYLCTGGYDRIKGSLEVIRAFSSVIKGDDSRLLLLGTKPNSKTNRLRKFLFINSEKTYIEELDKAISSDNRIRIIPNTYFIKHIYEQAYCVLSYFKIPHANLALAESIILHIPVIAAENAESLEYSIKGELAVLYKENNYNDFKEQLMAFDRIEPLLKKKLKEKSTYVEKMFNPEANIKKLEEVYQKLLS